MKKVISKILILVLLIANIQGVNLNLLFAKDTNVYKLEVLKKVLAEGSKGLEIGDRSSSDGETALVKWDISAVDKYTLTYYIEARNNTTKKVELTLDNDGSNIGLKGGIYENGTLEKVNYTPRTLNSGTNAWGNGTSVTGADYIETTLKLDNVASSFKEYSTVVTSVNIGGENLKLRIKIENGFIYIYTNGLAKGIVGEFALTTSGTPVGDTEATIKFFNGPKNFAVTPVHLKDNSVDSLEVIDDLKTVTPGSRPGIKVAFDQIKVLDGETFKVATNSNDLERIMIKLQPQYTTNGTVQDGDDSIRLDFKPVAGETIKINTVTNGSQVIENNGEINIYLANTLEGKVQIDPSKVIEWNVLTPSMVVDSLLTYGGAAEIYKPENKGHTYLDYTLSKTTNNEVQFTIKPYNINAAATYTIYSSSNFVEGDPNNTFSQKVTYQYDPNKTNNQEITSSVVSTNVTYFKVQVDIDGKTYVSQIVKYDPRQFSEVPTTPSIKTVDNVYVVPSDENSTSANPVAIGFDIEWFAPQKLKTLLNGGDLYYELLVRKNKADEDPLKSPSLAGTEGYAAYSKIFKISLDNSGKVIVEPYLGTAGVYDQAESEANKLIRYNESKGTFKMENVSLMNFNETSSNWEQIEISSSFNYATATEYLKDPVAVAKDTLKDMTIPNNYYLSLRTVYVSSTKSGEAPKVISYSNESNLTSIALNITKEVIPVPTTVGIEDITLDKSNITEKVTFSYVDIQNYVNKMIEPARLKLYKGANRAERYSGEYEFYLYQNKDALNQVNLNKLEPIKVTTGSALNVTTATINNKTALQELKDGGVVPFKVHISELRGAGQGEIEIEGLDPNTVYYLQVRTKLSPIKSKDELVVDARYSLLSKIFTFTTTTEITPPTPEDKVPPVPESIFIVRDENDKEMITNNSVTIGWSSADFEEDDDIDNTYYEFIRTEKQLTDDEKRLTVEKLVEANKDRVGFRSDKDTKRAENEPAYMSTYTSQNKVWTNLSPLQLSSKFQLHDNTLNPNNVYYYYVRTVCMIDGKAVKSKWIMVPVTTSPVNPPINLKVEPSKNYDHDTKKEIVISFDAPIPEGANVPSDFDFDFAVKSELDDDYKTSYSVTRVTSKEDEALTPSGYTHFVYKITGLKSNKRYDIKVRIIDKTKPILATGSYPTSLYCDKVTTRTDYDEEEAAQDNKFEEYLKKFDSEVEKLKRKPYWVVKDGTTYKYRESYLTTELGVQKEYELVGGEDTSKLYYYLPASTFDTATNSNTIIKVTLGNHTLSIRPNTLLNTNDAINAAIKKMGSRSIKDYYVGLEFKVTSYSDKIKGSTPLTPQISVNMELIYMDQTELITEDDIMIALNKIVEKERLHFINNLEKKVYNGKIADDILQELIDDAMEDIQDDHEDDVADILSDHRNKKVTINTIDKAMLLTSVIDAFAVDAYYFSGAWVGVESYQVGTSFAIEAEKLGNYIFTGQADLLTTVPSLAPYQSFISKYNLTDFFELTEYMIKTAATKEQVYGATARIMGAKRGTDYTNYLKNNGIKGITTIGLNKSIRQDEAIYIIMQAYEKRYNRKIASVVIKNKQSVQNIGAFQSIYRTYVYVGVELKIVENPNSKVLPSKEMTAEEIIKMLYKMQAQ